MKTPMEAFKEVDAYYSVTTTLASDPQDKECLSHATLLVAPHPWFTTAGVLALPAASVLLGNVVGSVVD